MKTRIFIATRALFVTQITLAQMTAKKAAQFEDDLITKEITTLTQEQKDTLSEINLKYAQQRTELMSKDSSLFSKMGDMKKINKNKEAEMAKILTEEQLEQYKDKVAPEVRKEMRKNFKQ